MFAVITNYITMKTIIKIESKSKADIDLFFELLGGENISRSPDASPFEVKGTWTSLFELDFKALQKNVTIKNKKNKNVTKRKRVVKQDISRNSYLAATAGLYASSGMSMQKIADKMNKDGHKNSRGNKINKEQVQRWLKKYRAEEAKLLKQK